MPFLPADPVTVVLTFAGLVLATVGYWRLIRRRHRERRLDRQADAEQLRGLVRVSLINQ